MTNKSKKQEKFQRVSVCAARFVVVANFLLLLFFQICHWSFFFKEVAAGARAQMSTPDTGSKHCQSADQLSNYACLLTHTDAPVGAYCYTTIINLHH